MLLINVAFGGAWPATTNHTLFMSYQKSYAPFIFNSLGQKSLGTDHRINASIEYGYRWKPAHLVGLFVQSAAVTSSIPRLGLFWQAHPDIQRPLSVRFWLGHENQSLFSYVQLLLGQSGSMGAWHFFAEIRPGITFWSDRPITIQAELVLGTIWKNKHMVSIFGWPQWHGQSTLPSKAYERFYFDINYFYQFKPNLWVGIGYHKILQGRQHPAFEGWQGGVIWNF